MRWQAVGKILAGTATAAVAAVLLGSAHFASAGGAVQAAGGQVAAAAAAEAPAQTVSAVGVAETPAGDAGQMMTLDVGVQQQSQGAELTAAVSAVQAKIAAGRAALQQAGFPAG
ncbi:MAG: hypothetical protein NTZ05_08380, partial [Chloroflexi bacterium]|nr:hypothetical protein [Chloroflexota bacterium]